MQKACDIGKKGKFDPLLRKYLLISGGTLGLVSMIGGFYVGFGVVSNEAVVGSPLLEKIFLTTFIAVSCGAAGLIIGAAIGSTVYRFKERASKK